MSILCSISTRGRYHTTLPLAIQSVIMQTKKPDKLIIFDDNDQDKIEDMREVHIYQYLFEMLQLNGIKWEWVFAERKGQHYNHQKANKMGFDWIWRLDDDTVAEPDVLEKLYYQTLNNNPVGAVGGSILTPPFPKISKVTGKIENIDKEPNIQWDYIKQDQDVDHLHCSFLYKAGINDFDLRLSKVAHREETIFTYGLKRKGYRIIVTPTVTWHLRNREGGIRDEQKILFDHDEMLFRLWLDNRKIVILDNGLGDHIVFKHVMPKILEIDPNPFVFSCWPDIIPGKSIQDARNWLGDIEQWNIYQRMDEWNWKGSLQSAFEKLYEIPILKEVK